MVMLIISMFMMQLRIRIMHMDIISMTPLEHTPSL